MCYSFIFKKLFQNLYKKIQKFLICSNFFFLQFNAVYGQWEETQLENSSQQSNCSYTAAFLSYVTVGRNHLHW